MRHGLFGGREFGARKSDTILCNAAGMLIAIKNHFNRRPFRRKKERRGRNDPCHCGSGVKYKHCCLS